MLVVLIALKKFSLTASNIKKVVGISASGVVNFAHKLRQKIRDKMIIASRYLNFLLKPFKDWSIANLTKK